MLALLLALFATFPSTSPTAWMQPEAFRLTLGMQREEAVARLSESRWKLEPDARGEGGDLLLSYDSGKSAALDFTDGKLVAIRFELIGMRGEMRAAFDEIRARLERSRGLPQTAREKMLIYDGAPPHIIVVLTDEATSRFGERGLGYLGVRYSLPPTTPPDESEGRLGERSQM